MVAGYDRYFQIARCFRDEDLRADRQPEFTQIDVEASFIAPEDIYRFTEGLLVALWREGGFEATPPFERMRYADAMERFGCDRPDLRYGLELYDASALFRASDIHDRPGRARRGRAESVASRSLLAACSRASRWTSSRRSPSRPERRGCSA